MYCHDCGKQIPDGVKFCSICGAAQHIANPEGGLGQERSAPQQGVRYDVPAQPVYQQSPYTQPAAQKSNVPVPPKAASAKKGPIAAFVTIGVLCAALLIGKFLIAPLVSSSLNGNTGDSGGFGNPIQGDPSTSAYPDYGEENRYYRVESDSILYNYATIPAPQADTVGDNWDSYTIEINGKLLTFPCTLDDLKAAGFVIRSDLSESELIDAGRSKDVYYEMQRGYYMSYYVTFINGHSEPKPIRECLVGGITISGYDSEVPTVLPGGIVMGEETPDSLLAAYGPATTTFTYERPSDRGVWESYLWSEYWSQDSMIGGFDYTFDADTYKLVSCSLNRYFYFGDEDTE